MIINKPLHPGKIIHEIIIVGAALQVNEAAERLGVNRITLSRLLNGHAGISPDMALRLSLLLPHTDMAFLMDLQRDYDMWLAKKSAKQIHIKPLNAA